MYLPGTYFMGINIGYFRGRVRYTGYFKGEQFRVKSTGYLRVKIPGILGVKQPGSLGVKKPGMLGVKKSGLG